MHTGQLYNPQPHFTNREVPAGHVIQQGDACYPPIPMPPQQGIASQPHAIVTTPLMPFGGTVGSRLSEQHGTKGCSDN